MDLTKMIPVDEDFDELKSDLKIDLTEDQELLFDKITSAFEYRLIQIYNRLSRHDIVLHDKIEDITVCSDKGIQISNGDKSVRIQGWFPKDSQIKSLISWVAGPDNNIGFKE